MLKGATKEDFDRTVGIHPTCAEVIFSVISGVYNIDSNCWITKRKETRMLRLRIFALLGCEGSELGAVKEMFETQNGKYFLS